MKEVDIIGILGKEKDFGNNKNYNKSWRPTVEVVKSDQWTVKYYHIIVDDSTTKDMRDKIENDIRELSPTTKIKYYEMNWEDPWEFEDVYVSLFDLSKKIQKQKNRELYINITTGTHTAQICLFLLAEANRFGSKHLLQVRKPEKKDHFSKLTVINLYAVEYDMIAQRFEKESEDNVDLMKNTIKTENKKYNLLIKELVKVSRRSTDPILLLGPTGSGKTFLAKNIYKVRQKDSQVNGNFIAVNCATISGDIAKSALFGHKKGAYTGADKNSDGYLKAANGGVLFLDEVGELDLEVQSMLLKAIEDKSFIPLGSTEEEKSDFQLICGTNQDLKEMVSKGGFREDLLARINLWKYTLPGLKDRPEDIMINVKYELDKKGKKVDFNNQAWEMFNNFAVSDEALWKSNFRDLISAVTRMYTLSEGGRIKEKEVKDEIKRLKDDWDYDGDYQGKKDESIDLSKYLSHGKKNMEDIDYIEQVKLKEVIKVCLNSENGSDAAKKLFTSKEKTEKEITNYPNLIKVYLERFGLNYKMIKSLKT